jgi:hypothetical protein
VITAEIFVGYFEEILERI